MATDATVHADGPGPALAGEGLSQENAYVGPRPFPPDRTLYGRDRELLALTNRLLSERLLLLYSPSGAGKTSLLQAKCGLRERMAAEGFHLLPIVRVSHAPDVAAKAGVNRYLFSMLTALELGRPEADRRDSAAMASLLRPGESLPEKREGKAPSEPRKPLSPAYREGEAPSEPRKPLSPAYREGEAPSEPRKPLSPARTEPRPPENRPSRTDSEPNTGLAPEFLQQHLDALTPASASSSDDGEGPTQTLLVLDQFEELLTLDPSDGPAKRAFMRQLGTALKDPDRWALFAMREDYLAALEPYLPTIPTRLSATFRLDLLGRDAAGEAIRRPAAGLGVTVEDGAVDSLIADLARIQVMDPLDGQLRWKDGPYVEPLHLQVVCECLWHVRAARDRITADDFKRMAQGLGDDLQGVTGALARYYDTAVHETADQFLRDGVTERSLRNWFDRALISTSGLRLPVLLGNEKEFGLNPAVLNHLADRYLVRKDERHGGIYYELAHDRLIEPIRKSNAAWRRQNPDPLEKRASLWHRLGRPESLLLDDPDSPGAEDQAAPARPLTSLETEYLESRRTARERVRERQAREKARARRNVTVLVCLLAAWIVASSVAGFVVALWRQAEQARDEAATQLIKTEEQRLHAERLSALLSMQRGLASFEEGEVGTAMLCLTQALKDLPAGEDDLDRIIRTQLAFWRQEIHELKAQLTHKGPVWAVAYAPGGKTVLTGSDDATAQLWDTATGNPVGPRLEHSGPVRSLAFSPDGKTAVTGSLDNTARLWNAASGRPAGQAMAHGGRPTATFSHDGTTVLTSSDDGTVRLWDALNGRPLHRPAKAVRLHDAIYAATFSHDDKVILTGADDTTARLWDATTGEPIGQAMKHEGKVRTVAYSPRGTTVLTGSEDGKARLWDAQTRKLVGHPMVHKGIVWVVAYSPDGNMVVTGSEDGSARVWNASDGAPIGRPLEHRGPVRSVAFGPDSRMVVTGSFDNSARIWDARTGAPVGAPLKYLGPVWAVAYAPGGDSVLIGSIDNTARIWDARSGDAAVTAMRHEGPVNVVAYHPEGRAVVSGSDDKTARIWDAKTGQQVGKDLKHQRPVWAVAFSPDGQSILTGSDDQTARLWSYPSGQPEGGPMDHESAVRVAAFSPDGRTVLTATYEGKAQLWDPRTRRFRVPQMVHGGSVWAATFNPDGTKVVTGSEDRTARVWDTATGKLIGEPMVHDAPVWAVAFSPDGTKVVTGSDDRTARIWDAATGKALAQPLQHWGEVRAVAFGLGGQAILTGSFDNTARIWDATKGSLLYPPLDHRGPVGAVAFNPDGKVIVTASDDRTARLWEVSKLAGTGAEERVSVMLSELVHQRAVAAVAFSPDGKTVLTGSRDDSARLWRAPVPIASTIHRIGLWTRIITGMELDDWGTIRFLDEPTWRRYREEYLTQRGPAP